MAKCCGFTLCFLMVLLCLYAVDCATHHDKSEADQQKAEDSDINPNVPSAKLSSSNTPLNDMNIETYANCAEIQKANFNESGVYLIYPTPASAIAVYCDLHTEGGSWTVFQNRMDGSVDFYLGYQAYEHGFGDVAGEYWLGLSHIKALVEQTMQELRVDLGDIDGNTFQANYSRFYIASASDGYRLHVGAYMGTAGDSLTYLPGCMYTTEDMDQDNWSGNCAEKYKGAWWYNNCGFSNLNGQYYSDGVPPSSYEGLVWRYDQGTYNSMLHTQMKIRPAYFSSQGSMMTETGDVQNTPKKIE